MKSTKKKSSKSKKSKEKEQKDDYKEENMNITKEEELFQEEEKEKLKIINNKNNFNKDKSIFKTEIKEESLKNINAKICAHINTETEAENNDIEKESRCVPLEIYTKVYEDKQTLINHIEVLNQKINTIKSEDFKLLENKYKK